jgi:hypothetical protein
MVQMIKKNRQDFRGMVCHFGLDELAELAKHVERGVAHHWSWVSYSSPHDGKKCWQVLVPDVFLTALGRNGNCLVRRSLDLLAGVF